MYTKYVTIIIIIIYTEYVTQLSVCTADVREQASTCAGAPNAKSVLRSILPSMRGGYFVVQGGGWGQLLPDCVYVCVCTVYSNIPHSVTHLKLQRLTKLDALKLDALTRHFPLQQLRARI